MCCGGGCGKFTLIVFNIIFWLAGGALLGVSIWALVNENVVHFLNIAAVNNSAALIRVAGITLAVVGGVIFITGFFGCCGAIKGSVCMLNTYAAFVIILLVTEVIAGILAIVFKDKLKNGLRDAMKTTIEDRYGVTRYKAQTQAIDFLQVNFQCCGVANMGGEYDNSNWQASPESGSNVVPVTCCVLKDRKANTPEAKDRARCNNKDRNYFHRTGCYDTMYNWIIDHSTFLIGFAFGLAGLQIIVIILACCLKKNLKKDNYQEV